MAYLRTIPTRQRNNGKPVVHYEVCWTEPVLDPVTLQPVRNPKTNRRKVRSRSETFAAHDEAKARKAELDGTPPSPSTPATRRKAGERTFGEFAAEWLADLRADAAEGRIKANTVAKYERELRRDALLEFGATPVNAITRKAAKDFRAKLAASGRARSTIQHAYDPFRWVLDYAQEQVPTLGNPANRTQRDKRKERNTVRPVPKSEVLSPTQVGAVSASIAATHPGDGPVYSLVAEFTAYTGLRAGELAGLDVGDVVLSPPTLARTQWSGYVSVTRQRHKVKGEWIEDTPKSANSTRKVPLPSWLADKLAGYLADTHPNATPTAPLFPGRKRGGYRPRKSRNGLVPLTAAQGRANLDWTQPINPGTFYERILKPAYRAVGVPVTDKANGTERGCTLHSLRHTFATTALQSGVHYQRVSEWLGHVNYVITLTIYAHWIVRDDTAEINKLTAPTAPLTQPTGGPATPATPANVLPFDRSRQPRATG